jgi:cytochrome c oxidase subunit 2
MEQHNLSIFSPASPPAESIRTLSVLVLVITGLIFVVVEGILIYLIVRSRRRAVDDTKEPPQLYGSQPIEIAWTAAPALIVFILTLVATRSLWEVRVDPPEPHAGSPALFVTVIGHQWWWEYRYESYDGKSLGFTAANELHVPASDDGTPRPIYLTLKSADVCHSFWVPRLAGKTDLIPGRVNSMWFQTKEKGLFVGQCAEYCGTQHANMLLRINVDSPGDFALWVENQQKPAIEEPAASQGKAAFLSQSCVNCHTVRGTPAMGNYAPDLTHLMSRETLAAGVVRNTSQELRHWIDDPQEVKPGCLMPAFGLGDRERDGILSYLGTLR